MAFREPQLVTMPPVTRVPMPSSSSLLADRSLAGVLPSAHGLTGIGSGC